MSRIIDGDAVFARLSKISGAKSDADIARLLGMTRQAITNARKRNSIPYEGICGYAAENDISLNALFFGEEEASKSIDINTFNVVTENLSGQESELRAINSVDFGGIAALIYNQACEVSGDENKLRVINGAINMLNITALQQSVDQLSEFAKDPSVNYENTAEHIDFLTKRIEELQVSKPLQSVIGDKNQTAGQDIVNNGRKGD